MKADGKLKGVGPAQQYEKAKIRGILQSETLALFIFHPRGHGLVLLFRRCLLQIDYRKRYLQSLVDQLQRLAVTTRIKRSAQRLMPLAQLLQSTAQRKQIEARTQMETEEVVIDRCIGCQLAVKEHAELQRCEGIRIFDVVRQPFAIESGDEGKRFSRGIGF